MRSWPVPFILVATLSGCGRSAINPAQPPFGLTYGRSWRVYMAGEPLPPLSPSVSGHVVSYTVSPPLPDGLALDARSGVIGGTPTVLVYPGVVHTITARSGLGVSSTELDLSVLEGFVIDDAGLGGDATPGDGVCAGTAGSGCTVRAALEETAALSTKRALLFPEGVWPLDGELHPGDDGVALVGTSEQSTVLDLAAGGRLKSMAVELDLSDLTVQNATVGAVAAECCDEQRVRASHVTFHDDKNDIAAGDGGALTVAHGSVAIEYATFDGNVAFLAPGLSVFEAAASVRFSAFLANRSYKVDNSPGAIAAYGSTATVAVESCYFNSNTAAGPGAAISTEYGAALRVTNSTFYGNHGVGWPGGGAIAVGLHRPSVAWLGNNTFVANDSTASGGALTADTSSITLVNNVFVGNTGALGADDCNGGSFSSLGGNVSDTADADCGWGTGDLVADPRLVPGAGAQNGGPLPTIALSPDSPAVDFGIGDDCPFTDARGFPRPIDGGNGAGGPPDRRAVCDAGAFELQ